MRDIKINRHPIFLSRYFSVSCSGLVAALPHGYGLVGRGEVGVQTHRLAGLDSDGRGLLTVANLDRSPLEAVDGSGLQFSAFPLHAHLILPWTPQQLQDVSPHVEAMQEALTDSRAKGIYRKGAAYGGEDDNQVGD